MPMSYHTRPIPIGVGLFICTIAGLFGQSPAASKLEFEVASVKPAAPMTGGMFRIGMRVDAGRMDYENVTLRDCIRTAYRLKDFQVVGPDWLTSARFDITAKLPEGSTKEQVPEMLQALLVERFKIAVHHESKPHDTYALVVAKNGPKLVASVEDKDDPAGSVKVGGPSAGAQELKMTTAVRAASGGGGGATFGMTKGISDSGTIKMDLKKQTLTNYADTLGRFLGSPVADQTAIEGKYDFSLELSRDSLMRSTGLNMVKMGAANGGGGGPSAETGNPADAADADSENPIFKSVQQYGLKLEKRKAPVDILVIDRIEKSPTEN